MVECEYSLVKSGSETVASFNRYMVECESVNLNKRVCQRCGFNRYMVECEYITNFAIGGVYFVLIDTWWNVNVFDGE